MALYIISINTNGSNHSFAFISRITWQTTEYIGNCRFLLWMVNFVYCLLLYITEDRREYYQEEEMHSDMLTDRRYYKEEKMYSDILTGQRISIVDFENSQTFMHIVTRITWLWEVKLKFEYMMVNVMWYTYWKRITIHNLLIFNVDYLATNWIWKRIIIFQY